MGERKSTRGLGGGDGDGDGDRDFCLGIVLKLEGGLVGWIDGRMDSRMLGNLHLFQREDTLISDGCQK